MCFCQKKLILLSPDGLLTRMCTRRSQLQSPPVYTPSPRSSHRRNYLSMFPYTPSPRSSHRRNYLSMFPSPAALFDTAVVEHASVCKLFALCLHCGGNLNPLLRHPTLLAREVPTLVFPFIYMLLDINFLCSFCITPHFIVLQTVRVARARY
jgi:hypothetical protein